MALFEKLKERLSRKPSLEVQQQAIRGLVTGKVYELMEKTGLTKSDLAKKMDVSKAAVTTLLSGDRNFTIDKLTEVGFYMDRTPKIDFVLLGERLETQVISLPTSPGFNLIAGGSSGESPIIQTGNFSIRLAGNLFLPCLPLTGRSGHSKMGVADR